MRPLFVLNCILILLSCGRTPGAQNESLSLSAINVPDETTGDYLGI